MDLATIVCEYIYGAFKIVKTAIDALLDVFEVVIEKLYSVAMSINNIIFTTLGKALDAILLIVIKALNALVAAMNKSINGTWSLCAPAFKCNFFLEQILDPDSLIAKTIRKILSGKNDCYCRQETKSISTVTKQSTSTAIATTTASSSVATGVTASPSAGSSVATATTASSSIPSATSSTSSTSNITMDDVANMTSNNSQATELKSTAQELKPSDIVATETVNNDKEEAIYSIQQTLFDIATDYENFKSQICNGLSLDMAIDMATDLCLDYLGQLNGWKNKIESKLKSLKKKLQALIDRFRESALFDLLEELQAFFECVIDSELCANVDSAKSYYNYVLAKLGLVEAGTKNYMISPNVENEILGTANSFFAKLNEGIKRVEGILNSLSFAVSVKGASNALDLTSTIKGVGSVIGDAINGNDIDWNKIPIIDYSNKKIEELNEAYDKLHQKTTNDPNEALRSNKCYTLNDVLLETVASTDGIDGSSEVQYLDVEPGADTSHAQELIQIGDTVYTVADAAKQIYTGEGNAELINFCKNIGALMDINDIVVRY